MQSLVNFYLKNQLVVVWEVQKLMQVTSVLNICYYFRTLRPQYLNFMAINLKKTAEHDWMSSASVKKPAHLFALTSMKLDLNRNIENDFVYLRRTL